MLPPKEEHHVKGQEKVEVSGETGDEHFKAKGHAAAEAHAKADTFSETFIDGSGVGVRGGAEASAGVSADADGSIKTDIGELNGHAHVSAARSDRDGAADDRILEVVLHAVRKSRRPSTTTRTAINPWSAFHATSRARSAP